MHGMTMVMTPDARIAIGTGIVILIAIATSHRHLRADMSILRGEIRGLRKRITKLEGLLVDQGPSITDGLARGLTETPSPFPRISPMLGVREGTQSAYLSRSLLGQVIDGCAIDHLPEQ